jgi:hypothetical protein
LNLKWLNILFIVVSPNGDCMPHDTTETTGMSGILTYGIDVFVYTETFANLSSFPSGHKAGDGGIFNRSLVVIVYSHRKIKAIRD